LQERIIDYNIGKKNPTSVTLAAFVTVTFIIICSSTSKMLSAKILQFLQHLELKSVPRGIDVLNPYKDPPTLKVCSIFYKKYYHDKNKRTLMLGINPGRFGSGTTGISFTDPIQLEKSCGIANPFPKSPELSSDFIYRVIHAYGGPEAFYTNYFISAVSPLGFTKGGKNINYYDDRSLKKAATPFIVQSISKILTFNIHPDRCFCIGEGANYKFLMELNKANKWFGEIVPLAHPRFVMQYKRKQLHQYIERYLKALNG
jgi:hypothetical protein